MLRKKNLIALSILALTIMALLLLPSASVTLNAERLVYGQNDQQIFTTSQDIILKHFDRELIQKLMKQPGTVEVRMYYVKNNDKWGFKLVGVDPNGNETVGIYGQTKLCPPYCGGS
jgi:hypothetical protein